MPNLARREHEKNLVPILLEALADLPRTKKAKYEVRSTRYEKILPQTSNLLSRPYDFVDLDSLLEREAELLDAFKQHISQLKAPDIDAIAVTNGPGLAPALWVGVNFAKALALLWDKPLIPVNHMAGHLYSALLDAKPRNPNVEVLIPKLDPPLRGNDKKEKKSDRSKKKVLLSDDDANHKLQTTNYSLQTIRFPAIALLVSGGHTELVLMRGHGKYKILGETLDDAAGEAFDKVARILGLGYPGGPEIAKQAQSEKCKAKSNNAKLTTLRLPRPMMHSKDYNFSFSGLKTAVLYLVRDLTTQGVSLRAMRPAIANEFQNAADDVLVKKTIRAAKEHNAKTVLLGGGVAASIALQQELRQRIAQELPAFGFRSPASGLAGDNALMIAAAAYFTGKKKAPTSVRAEPHLRLES